LAYGRHLAGIFSTTQAELTKTAEVQIAEANRKVISLIDEASKNAPAGSEQAISLVKTAFGNFNAGYEQFSKSAKQATEAMESNVSSAVEQLSQATVKATARSKK